MKTIEAKVQVDTNRTLTMHLPDDVEAGQYNAVLVLVSNGTEPGETKPLPGSTDLSKSKKWDQTTANAWAECIAEIEQTPRAPQPVQNDYHQHLIEKYRAQGLDL